MNFTKIFKPSYLNLFLINFIKTSAEFDSNHIFVEENLNEDFSKEKFQKYVKRNIEECTKNCMKNVNIKLNFMDMIVNRKLDEKAAAYCHLFCLKNLGLSNIKRNGRWAFFPIVGFSEFVSSLFAFLGLVINIYIYHFRLSRLIKFSPLSFSIKLHYHALNAAFFTSFMYHFNYNSFTRNADYSTALFSILVYTINSIKRIFLLYKINNVFSRNIMYGGIVMFVIYYNYMTFINFNAILNKLVIFFMVLVSNVCYIIIYFKKKNISNNDNKIMIRNLLTFSFLKYVSILFEVTDFPPVFYIIDSHALWHLGLFLSIGPYHGFQCKEIEILIKN
ncbi:PGAP3 [Hepatospora eriocheir]|uniref:Post-GPI attachment to proteins factor 3 n=1 Tax=Hepatospora eriocheir TaxID=1081669 RepID=A0A1X0QLP7_9MICR|nr:PGAP3 [Hepatospora eriocheir]